MAMEFECQQYSTVRGTFLREKFPRTFSILAQLFLRFEDPNISSRSVNDIRKNRLAYIGYIGHIDVVT
jgi:hypothetical protein